MGYPGLPERYRVEIASDLEKILLNIFSRESIVQHPKSVAVVDVAVSDLASELQGFVQANTPRGKVLGQHPLVWMGYSDLLVRLNIEYLTWPKPNTVNAGRYEVLGQQKEGGLC